MSEPSKKHDESPERGEKRPVEDVHSANQWENVELGGDSDRKNKFLRLMGASKKEHHGRFVIGDAYKDHTKAGGNVDEKDIEKEFDKGIDYKLSSGFKHHKGLGFHEEPKDAKEKDDTKEDTSEEKPEDLSKSKTDKSKDEVDKDNETKSENTAGVSETKNSETGENSSNKHSDKPAVKKMTFVKASS